MVTTLTKEFDLDMWECDNCGTLRDWITVMPKEQVTSCLDCHGRIWNIIKAKRIHK